MSLEGTEPLMQPWGPFLIGHKTKVNPNRLVASSLLCWYGQVLISRNFYTGINPVTYTLMRTIWDWETDVLELLWPTEAPFLPVTSST